MQPWLNSGIVSAFVLLCETSVVASSWVEFILNSRAERWTIQLMLALRSIGCNESTPNPNLKRNSFMFSIFLSSTQWWMFSYQTWNSPSCCFNWAVLAVQWCTMKEPVLVGFQVNTETAGPPWSLIGVGIASAHLPCSVKWIKNKYRVQREIQWVLPPLTLLFHKR